LWLIFGDGGEHPGDGGEHPGDGGEHPGDGSEHWAAKGIFLSGGEYH